MIILLSKELWAPQQFGELSRGPSCSARSKLLVPRTTAFSFTSPVDGPSLSCGFLYPKLRRTSPYALPRGTIFFF